MNYEIPTTYEGHKISEFLRNRGYSEQSLTRLRHTDGAIRVNGTKCHMNALLEEGQSLCVEICEEDSSEHIPAVALPIEILYEDEDILVVNKPSGMPIHPTKSNYENTLANGLAYYYKEKGEPFVFRCVNRLDRDTTGLAIIAKHFVSAGILYEAVKQRQVERIYTAIVEDPVINPISDTGTIDLPLGKKENAGIERCVDYENGDKAVTHYEVQKRIPGLALVTCQLENGRTHQIRVHMKAIGHPLIGDFLYNPSNHQMKRQALHAGKITFAHPMTGVQMSFETELPRDMKNIFL